MNMLIETIKNHLPLSSADEKIIRDLFHRKIIPKDEHLYRERLNGSL